MCRIDKSSGDTIQNKYVVSIDTTGYKVAITNAVDPLVKLNNGNYILSGRSFGTYRPNPDNKTPLYHSSLLEFDSDFNPISAYNFKSVVESSTSRITVQPDGSGLFSMQHYISGYSSDVYVVQFKNGQILKQRKKEYRSEGTPWEPLATRLPDGGDMIARMLHDSVKSKINIEFIQYHVSDTTSSCIGYNDTSFSIYPFKLRASSWYTDSVRSNVFKESITKTIIEDIVSAKKLPGCYTVSYCDSLKLVPSQKALCISQDLQITIRKNIACGSNVYWQYDTSVVNSTSQLNDSIKKFTFKRPWSGYIYGSIKGCDIITDSVFVQVVNAPNKLDLGSDFEICPNNSRILNAHSGYSSYLWQDGTKDSVFTVTNPGKYFVTTTSACGGTFTDTLIVNQHAPVFINLGGNRSKCNSDTIQINAPSGFINYYWSNNYNINYLNTSSIIVNPLIDTFYAIRAEKEPGCFAYDTVKVTVRNSPKIYLGKDTSLCKGDSLIVNTGMGFTGYIWNNGVTNSSLKLFNTGQYSVIATTAFGCKSYDTINILSVFNLPSIKLDHDNELCQGTSRILDAGNYKSYIWQDGSINKQLKVSSAGKYYVSVMDANNCKGTDTTIITTILPLPSKFLPLDTSICSYGKLTIQPNQDYSSYLWNTNSLLKTIVIEKPGIYWLDVKDSKNCFGRDSITVNLKQCMKGLYVPSAFTPNNDGKNDKLRALIFGYVASFNFTIYNRFGQIVFETSDYLKGWDGKINGLKQNIGNYVWVCRYQFVGEQPAIEKGTFILIN